MTARDAHAVVGMKRNTKIRAKAGKSNEVPTNTQPMKAPQRTKRQAGGLRASVNRGGKKRISG